MDSVIIYCVLPERTGKQKPQYIDIQIIVVLYFSSLAKRSPLKKSTALNFQAF